MTRSGFAPLTRKIVTTALCAIFLSLPEPAAATPTYWADNGHYYEVVHTSGIDWFSAKAAAEGLTYSGIGGHLVTITSDAENLWLTSTFGAGSLHYHWIGGYQLPGSSEPLGGWSWITGESWGFTNWWPPGEPNNFGGRENAIVFDHGVTAAGKSWNDLNHDTGVLGYVVEYSSGTGPIPPPPTPVPESTSCVLMLTGLLTLVSQARRGRG